MATRLRQSTRTTRVETSNATSEGTRDEPLGAGAAHQRIDEQPDLERPSSSGGQGWDAFEDNGIALLRQIYHARIEAVRGCTPKHEQASAVRALRLELAKVIKEVLDRARYERAYRADVERRMQQRLRQARMRSI